MQLNLNQQCLLQTGQRGAHSQQISSFQTIFCLKTNFIFCENKREISTKDTQQAFTC